MRYDSASTDANTRTIVEDDARVVTPSRRDSIRVQQKWEFTHLGYQLSIFHVVNGLYYIVVIYQGRFQSFNSLTSIRARCEV